VTLNLKKKQQTNKLGLFIEFQKMLPYIFFIFFVLFFSLPFPTYSYFLVNFLLKDAVDLGKILLDLKFF
jgi:hypothetical protein